MDIIFASATRIAAAIRAREVSAVEVLDAHLARIEERNPALNAVVILDAEAACRRAREADEALARGETWGPLHGVPFTLKDAHAVAGMRSTLGFPPFDHVPQADGTVAARLKGAGAVLMGKTNVATLLADHQTSNAIFGRTNNPWNLARTPGGSGGGAAAAVAAGLTPFELGTDLSGSTRLPAHFCGIYGLKPTEARVSLAGVFPVPRAAPRSVRVMSAIGMKARAVDDLALLTGVLAGPDGRDPEVPPVPVEPVPEVALRGLRIAFAPTFPSVPAAAAVRAAVEGLARQLDGSGAVVEPALPTLDFGAELEAAGALIGMMLGAFEQCGDGGATPLAGYLEALDRRDRAIHAWERFFDDWDALLAPAAMVPAFPHCEAGTPLMVDGAPAAYWTVAAHCIPFNYSGHPAVVLPRSLDEAGLPVGVQLVGRRWGESRLLAIARALAPLTGGFRRPPGY